jgi:O-methyltransferase
LEGIKGFFDISLRTANIHKLALLRLHGDMYGSTIQVLDELYDKVSIGGCKKATDDFRIKQNISSQLIKIDWTCVYWIKE